MKLTLLLSFVLLAGCDVSSYREQDGNVLCSLDGRAYLVGTDGIGVRITAKRSPQLDMLCKPMKESA
jgi:hypothetical protein